MVGSFRAAMLQHAKQRFSTASFCAHSPQLPVYCAMQIAHTSLRFISAQKPRSKPSSPPDDDDATAVVDDDVATTTVPLLLAGRLTAASNGGSAPSPPSSMVLTACQEDVGGGRVLTGYHSGSQSRAEAEKR